MPAALAVTVYDLDPLAPPPVLPHAVDVPSSPVFITNNGDPDSTGSAAVDSFRVGQYSVVHMGYGDRTPAAGRVAVAVAGDMAVEGKVYLGKDATPGRYGLPAAASTRAVTLEVGNILLVGRDGVMIADGASDGTDSVEHSIIRARRVDIAGGVVALDEYAGLYTTDASDPGAAESLPSIRVRDGGILALNGGTPPVNDPGAWIFKGIDVSAGGTGILIDRGGTIASGHAGGVIKGRAGQALHVARGGFFDASRGNVVTTGFGTVSIEGGYRAGLDGLGATTRLTAETGSVLFSRDAVISLSRTLQRHINRSGGGTPADAVVVRGKDIRFDNQGVPSLVTGMGTYGLLRETVEDPVTGESWEQLRVNSVENAVLGNSSDADKETFRRNMEHVWRPGRMDASMADNIYRLTAAETPSVAAVNESGRLNKAVLEAFVDGPGQPTGTGGVADQGVFEMYSGAAQWGVASVAHNTAGEFMAGLNRRVERIGAEMDRLGEGWGGVVSTCAVASPIDPDLSENRIWIGGHGRKEEAGLDYGVSGYTYRPRGFMAGYDRFFGPVNVGVAFAHGQGDYRDKAAYAGDSKITSYSGGLYGSFHAQNGLNASAFAAYSRLDNDLDDMRGGMRRTADHTSYAWSAGARAGYDMYLTDRFMLSPSAGVVKVRSENKSHDEFLDGVRVLRVGDMRRDSTLVPIDLAISFDLVKNPTALVRLTANAGYAYDFEDGGLDGAFVYEGLTGTNPMPAAGRKPGKNRYSLGAGIIYAGSRVDVGARYDYSKRSEQKTHQAQGSIGVKF